MEPDARDQLLAAARDALLDGWHAWELAEVVSATARSKGLEVSAPEVAEIVKATLEGKENHTHESQTD